MREEEYKEQLNQLHIRSTPCPDSPIRNDYNNDSSSSQVGNGGIQMQVGTDYYLRDKTSTEAMFLDAFQNDELGDDASIIDTVFKSLKYLSTTPLFGPD